MYTPDEGERNNTRSKIFSTIPRAPAGPRGLSCAAGRLGGALKVGVIRLRPPTVIAMVAGTVARGIGSAAEPVATSRDTDVGQESRRCVVPGVGYDRGLSPAKRGYA